MDTMLKMTLGELPSFLQRSSEYSVANFYLDADSYFYFEVDSDLLLPAWKIKISLDRRIAGRLWNVNHSVNEKCLLLNENI